LAERVGGAVIGLIGVAEFQATALGAFAGLISAVVVTVAKMLAEWGRPHVKLVTGAVDTLIGGFLVYNQLVAGKKTGDPFTDSAAATFGILELIVGLSALASGIGGVAGIRSLQVHEMIYEKVVEIARSL
jgi:uncharacterized YccA/Bax inhibitor family protein